MKKKKDEKESWRKKEREVLESGKQRKKRERIGIYGYTCVVEKNQEEKKNVWMIERKKERKNNI